MPTDFKELEKRAGRAPFEQRLRLVGGFCPCPFHAGDSDKSMHLHKNDSGIWRAKCFSTCNASWGPLDFVMKFDNLPTLQDAVARLGGRTVNPKAETSETPQTEAPKPRPKAMSRAEFAAWGREIRPADVERFARSRKGKGYTPSFETFQRLGCRVQGDFIGFPHIHPSGEFLYTLKMRHMDKKEFTAPYAAANDGFFNLDTVTEWEPVYIVEGEPDCAVLEEMDYRAVSISTATQSKFDKHALADIKQATEIYIIGDQVIPKRGKDNDPGAACMERLEAALADVQHKVYRIRFAVDGIEKEKELKDVSALLAHYGPEEFQKRFNQLRDEALDRTWVGENIPLVNAISRKPQRWLVDRFIPAGCLTMVCGGMGSTKSLLALYLAKYLTAPMPKEFLGRKIEGNHTSGVLLDIENETATKFREMPVAPVPVLYLDRENAESTVGERLSKIGVIGRDNFHYWGDWVKGGDMPQPDDPRLLKWAVHTGGLIIFDSLQDWYGERKEIDTSAMVELMEKFKHLARQCAGVVVLHHTPKPKDDTPTAPYRGSTGIVALTDMAISLTKMKADDEEIFWLRPIRFRMCAEWEMDYKIRWNADGEGNYAIGVTRDQIAVEAAKERKSEKQNKAAVKESTKQTFREILDRLIIDGNFDISKADLAAQSGVEKTKMDRLLAGRWDFKATRTPKWQRIGSPAPIVPDTPETEREKF